MDYVIVNSSDHDTQVQVRGRVNSDLETLYVLNKEAAEIIIPDVFLGKRLFAAEKSELCKIFKRVNGDG